MLACNLPSRISCLWRKLSYAILWGWCLITALPPAAWGQERGPSSDRRAIAHYADAAGFQNKGAYQLAIEEWEKLLKEFPKDPLASKAWHYLGVCNIQLESPNYGRAVEAFDKALEDEKLEVREEALINASWCLFTQARTELANSQAQKTGYEKARLRLLDFLRNYGDGNYADQALFYLGEIEYSLGSAKKAIPYYQKLLDTKSLEQSSLRSDARYALAVAYEESGQPKQAAAEYKRFLADHAQHRLVNEVRARLADLLLQDNQPEEAARLLTELTSGETEELTDYAMLRLGYAMAQQGKDDLAREQYERLLSKYPESKHAPTAALAVGQARYQSGEYDEAVELFRLALEPQDKQSAEAVHWMAVSLLRQSKPQEVLELIDSTRAWTESTPSAVGLQMDYADALYAIPAELEKARLAYEILATEHPDDPLAPRAAYNTAFAALQAGKVVEARRWAELFLNRYPQDPLRNDVAYVAAEALLQQGEHAAAARAYGILRDADPQNTAFPLWTLRMAMARYLAGEYDSAIALLSKELPRFATDAQTAEAQYILGASYLYQEDVKRAIELLSSSHQTSDQWSSADEVLLLLAEAYQRDKDNLAARSTLELLLKKFPASRLKAQVEYKLAQLSAGLEQYDQAITQYRALVADPSAANYHRFAAYGVVWCLMQKENYQAALDNLPSLLQQGQADSIGLEAKLAQGICLRKLGRGVEAIEVLEDFLAERPTGNSLGNALYEVGLAYVEQGDVELASARFLRLLAEVPDYQARDKVLYELAWNFQESSTPSKASEYFRELARDYPASEFSAEAMYMLGQQQYDEQKYDQAAASYESVLIRSDEAELLEKAQYKLGWSLFQQERYAQAAEQFMQQANQFAEGPLAVDALFMKAECTFKQESFDQALSGYKQARQALESQGDQSAASEQVKTLIYLHGAQCFRELGQWSNCEEWLRVVVENYPRSPYLWTAVYELGYCKQQQGKPQDALKYYTEVVDNNRNEIGARARFMMGEVYFSQRDFRRAIEEFTRVAFGFGGEKAADEIKNWQAKSAFEAARCYEVLVADLKGDSRQKALAEAEKFYEEIVEVHAAHDLAAQAQNRLSELQKLR
jgi:TolA-binding protein